MMMVKSNVGSGYVEDVVFENFIGHGNAWSLNIDQQWASMKTLAGDGVQLRNMTFKNWKGTVEYGLNRGPVKVACADKVSGDYTDCMWDITNFVPPHLQAPCTDINIQDLAMWTENGNHNIYQCQNGYGSGFCLKKGTGPSYAATTSTQTAAPTGYSAPTMKENLKTAFGTASPIPIPTMPASFYPNTPPITKLAGQ